MKMISISTKNQRTRGAAVCAVIALNTFSQCGEVNATRMQWLRRAVGGAGNGGGAGAAGAAAGAAGAGNNEAANNNDVYPPRDHPDRVNLYFDPGSFTDARIPEQSRRRPGNYGQDPENDGPNNSTWKFPTIMYNPSTWWANKGWDSLPWDLKATGHGNFQAGNGGGETPGYSLLKVEYDEQYKA
jgi:hypothetical protein